MKRAFITGITGQDGSYLAELLLAKNYEVHGLVRLVSLEDPSTRSTRINELIKGKKIHIHWGDVVNYETLWKIIATIKPDEIYHLAAISTLKGSFADEFGTLRTNLDSVLYLLSSIKELKPDAKFYFAGSSEMFGRPSIYPQDENTPLNPISPYAITKATGLYLTRMYREANNIFACTGIAYNHESPRRGLDFVTRKITHTAARIKAGLEGELRVGDLETKRDWGFAGDFVEAMWLMLQAERPSDFVIGTGENHTVQEFIELTFGFLELDWRKYVTVDKELLRPPEKCEFLANPSKAKKTLGWNPKTRFKNLVEMMVKEDLRVLGR